MIDITNDIQSLTTSRRRSGDFMKQLKRHKRPMILRVKGKAAAIVQDAEADQRLLDTLSEILPASTSESTLSISDAALKWYRGIKDAILSLEEHPNHCPMTPESEKLRHLLYGKKPHTYRVIHQILEKKKQVDVLHIRHGARRGFKE